MRLSFLHELYQQDGPSASVYLTTERHTADAAKALALRWRNARFELDRMGMDEATRSRRPSANTAANTATRSWPGSGRSTGAATRAAGSPRWPRPCAAGRSPRRWSRRRSVASCGSGRSHGSVLVRAAVATDAEVLIVPDLEPPDRIGALLRYTAP